MPVVGSPLFKAMLALEVGGKEDKSHTLIEMHENHSFRYFLFSHSFLLL